MKHISPRVQQALDRLLNELCEWERNTGRQSGLILREQGGFVCRAQSGKPVNLLDISDAQIIAIALDSQEWVSGLTQSEREAVCKKIEL